MESYGVYPLQKLHKLTPVLLAGTARFTDTVTSDSLQEMTG